MVTLLHILDWLSLILACLSLNAISFIFGRKEAWGYSRTGQPGMLKLIEEYKSKSTHALFNVERLCLALIMFSIGYQCSLSLWSILVFAAYFPMTFSLFHTIGYNSTMIKLGVKGYENPLQDYSNTDAKFDLPNSLEVTFTWVAIIGVIIIKIFLL